MMSMSGTRGVVGDTLTVEIALRTGLAYGTFWRSRHIGGDSPSIIVGGDTRTSHDTYKSAIISGILATGVNVIDIGRVTTPTVQQMIHRFSAIAGVVITASHNPVIWNGIKLMSGSGAFLDEVEYASFLAIYDAQLWSLADWSEQGTLTVDHSATQAHVEKIISLIDCSKIRASKLRVAVDANHGAGAVADPVLFASLGIDATIINAEPHGRFAHDPEPLESNLSQLKAAMASGAFDIGFAQDADADRLVILDQTGRFIGEDYSLAFCVDYILNSEQVTHPSVVVNLSTSRILDWITDKHGGTLTATKIGESHVTQGIRTLGATVGGEGNGGVIYPRIGWGRDSLVGMVVALAHLADAKRSVSDIVSDYPQYVMLRDKIAVESRESVAHAIGVIKDRFSDFPQNLDDGVKVTLPNGWVHVRPSNTEPIIRLFVEANSASEAREIMTKAQLV
ncbi:phosphoglucosamine mutase [bacterium]|nr:phosphoglucosamine mutase [bacterium]